MLQNKNHTISVMVKFEAKIPYYYSLTKNTL